MPTVCRRRTWWASLLVERSLSSWHWTSPIASSRWCSSAALPPRRATGDSRRRADEFSRFAAGAEVDWSNRDSVVDYLVGYSRVLAGGQRPFDEAAQRDLVQRDIERTLDVASLQNHDVIAHDDRSHPDLSTITAPTLVIHGTADPMFPLAHGEALAEEIPDATLLALDSAGHGVDRADWDTIVDAIVRHTAQAARATGPGPAQ